MRYDLAAIVVVAVVAFSFARQDSERENVARVPRKREAPNTGHFGNVYMCYTTSAHNKWMQRAHYYYCYYYISTICAKFRFCCCHCHCHHRYLCLCRHRRSHSIIAVFIECKERKKQIRWYVDQNLKLKFVCGGGGGVFSCSRLLSMLTFCWHAHRHSDTGTHL